MGRILKALASRRGPSNAPPDRSEGKPPKQSTTSPTDQTSTDQSPTEDQAPKNPTVERRSPTFTRVDRSAATVSPPGDSALTQPDHTGANATGSDSTERSSDQTTVDESNQPASPPIDSGANASGGLAGFNLDDLAAQTRSGIEAARREAESILQTARVEGERIRRQSAERGYREGMANAQREFETKVDAEASRRATEAVANLQTTVDQIRTATQQWLDRYAALLSQTVVAATGRILNRKLVDEPEILLEWAKQSLAAARSADRLTLAVHPETLARWGEELDRIVADSALPDGCVVVGDPDIPTTEIVVRRPGGEVRNGIDPGLGRLNEMLDELTVRSDAASENFDDSAATS